MKINHFCGENFNVKTLGSDEDRSLLRQAGDFRNKGKITIKPWK
jgi:hypothetical protein